MSIILPAYIIPALSGMCCIMHNYSWLQKKCLNLIILQVENNIL